MIPLKLKLSGFLSYRDQVEVDFTTFGLACISGHNGAGKSSLLDAITWVLFGQARKHDDTLVNNASDTAEVVFTFSYEENVYRIQRVLPRGKTSLLEFQILDDKRWRPLTEATMRSTQDRIINILRLDYETFVNAAFFLQGKADQFTQQRPADRKRILSSILGLELWETYRERTADRRKVLERDVDTLDGRLAEINTELAEEATRKARLNEFEAELSRLKEIRKTQELALSTIKQAIDNLKRQKDLGEKINSQINRVQNDFDLNNVRLSQRKSEHSQYTSILLSAQDVEKAYQAWQAARLELEKWNALAVNFHEQEKVRQEPLAKIGAEQARLELERDTLHRRETEIEEKKIQFIQYEKELGEVQKNLFDLESRLKLRSQLERSQSIIARFREQAKLRQQPLSVIESEKARLEQELKTLDKKLETMETLQVALKKLEFEFVDAKNSREQSESQLNLRKKLEQAVQVKKERQFVLKSSNERLKLEMDALAERIKKLEDSEGAVCPLCGQPLSAGERLKLIDKLRMEGKEKGAEYRTNKTDLENILKEISSSETEISGFGRIEQDHLFHHTTETKISERMNANIQAISEWENGEAPRRAEIKEYLRNETYCLNERHHLSRIDRELKAIGTALGVKNSDEKSIFDSVEEKVLEIETEIASIRGFEEERITLSTRATQLTEQINVLQSALDEWDSKGKPRVTEIVEILEANNFSLPERQKLAEIDGQLKSLGYDPAAHDALRQAEQAGRSSENDLRELQAARAALVPLEREMVDIQNQIATQQHELEALKIDYETEQKLLAELEAKTPDIHEAERVLYDAQERENILIREVGAAQQKVSVLKELRIRKTNFETHREELAILIKNHKTLERAFGKDGVPALLIEQALPQIEEKANELLDRLSNGTMNVRFVTQAGYKDKKREDLKETLEIQISDGAGTRDYEMFSGGEAFRVNFAIRLALSEVLARRTGARLQTLVIDEGFGSQDAEGRQRLIEAINQVKNEFAKIIIITHLDELKDAFPNRIEVEKTPRGSTVKVI